MKIQKVFSLHKPGQAILENISNKQKLNKETYKTSASALVARERFI